MLIVKHSLNVTYGELTIKQLCLFAIIKASFLNNLKKIMT